MPDPVTILLAPPQPDLAAELAQLRNDLRIVSLAGTDPPVPCEGRLMGFIDWILPELSGLELCRRLREGSLTRHAHLTLVLDNPDSDARRRALAAGADDYMPGPLTARELLARIEPLVPEPARSLHGARLRHGELHVDPQAFQARFRGRLLTLRPNEFHLLVHFLLYPDQVFSRSALIDRLGKDAEALDERTVDVWVGRLRRGLRAQGVPDPLRTVRSLGYVLDSIPL